MRRLLESLTPDDSRFYWSRVGGMFVLYVGLMISAAGIYVGHESSRKLAHEPATTVAVGANARSIVQASMPMRRVAGFD